MKNLSIGTSVTYSYGDTKDYGIIVNTIDSDDDYLIFSIEMETTVYVNCGNIIRVNKVYPIIKCKGKNYTDDFIVYRNIIFAIDEELWENISGIKKKILEILNTPYEDLEDKYITLFGHEAIGEDNETISIGCRKYDKKQIIDFWNTLCQYRKSLKPIAIKEIMVPKKVYI